MPFSLFFPLCFSDLSGSPAIILKAMAIKQVNGLRSVFRGTRYMYHMMYRPWIKEPDVKKNCMCSLALSTLNLAAALRGTSVYKWDVAIAPHVHLYRQFC